MKRKKSVTIYLTDSQLDEINEEYLVQANADSVLTFQRYLQECLVYGNSDIMTRREQRWIQPTSKA